MTKSFMYFDTLISYRVVGKGDAVLLLHGFGEDSTIWHQQEASLQDHCRLIIPDLPGSGLSGILHPKKDADTINIDDYADCVHALMQLESEQPFTIMGHSMGGYIALAYAAKHQANLAGFGLLHSTAFADNAKKIESRKQAIEMLQQHSAFAFLKNTIPNLFANTFRQTNAEVVNTLIDAGSGFTKEALIQYTRAMMERPDRTAVLGNLTVPVLVIAGSDDAAVPLADVLQQVHLPQITYFHLLENVGHMGMLEAPGLFNEHLQHFILNVLHQKQ